MQVNALLKSAFSVIAISATILTSGCKSDDQRAGNSVQTSVVASVGGREITDFELNFAEAYNYDSKEIYTIDGNFYNPLMFTGGSFYDETFVFQGQNCSVSSAGSSYTLETDDEGYSAKLSEAYVNSSGELNNIGHISVKGIAYFDGEGWVIRPLRDEGDTALPLLGDFSDEELAEIDGLSTVEINGEEFKTHPFIFYGIQNMSSENEPEILSDKSRAYLAELETEGLTFYAASDGNGAVRRRDQIFYNRVLSAEDIGERPLSE